MRPLQPPTIKGVLMDAKSINCIKLSFRLIAAGYLGWLSLVEMGGGRATGGQSKVVNSKTPGIGRSLFMGLAAPLLLLYGRRDVVGAGISWSWVISGKPINPAYSEPVCRCAPARRQNRPRRGLLWFAGMGLQGLVGRDWRGPLAPALATLVASEGLLSGALFLGRLAVAARLGLEAGEIRLKAGEPLLGQTGVEHRFHLLQ